MSLETLNKKVGKTSVILNEMFFKYFIITLNIHTLLLYKGWIVLMKISLWLKKIFNKHL